MLMNKIKIISLLTLCILLLSIIPFTNAQKIENKNNKLTEDFSNIKNAILKNNADWIASETAISELTNQEKQLLLGAYHEDYSDVNEKEVTSSFDLPGSFDWRDVDGTKWVTPITDQKNCGSCVAFGVIAALESVLQISSNNIYEPDLSEANLFFCGGGSCGRGWVPTTALEHLKTDGVPDEEGLPYINPQDIDCQDSSKDWRSRRVKISSYGSVGNPQMKEYLITHGPLIVTFDVFEDFFYYQSGIYEHVWGTLQGGHCVAVVGYNDTDNYWICKNSWGPNWGENGYFKIKYRKCGLDDSAKYVIVDTSNPPSSPTIPIGAENGQAGVSLSFSVQAADPDLDGLYYVFDWGDESITKSKRAYPSEETGTLSHIWSTPYEEDFKIKVKAVDVYGYESDWSNYLTVTITNNAPQKPVRPSGPSSGVPDTEYEYQTQSTDEDGDNLYYLFDWGDGTDSGWIGEFRSGDNVTANHIWSTQGTFNVKVKTKDIRGAESDWSDPSRVAMPKNKISKNLIMFKILQKISFKNSIFSNFIY